MTLLAVLLIGGVGWALFVLLRRGRRRHGQKQGQAAPPARRSGHNAAGARPSLFQRWFGGRKEPDPQQQFAAWVALVPMDPPELQAWLKGLSGDEQGALVTALTEFCAGLGFDLSWLYLPSSTANKELQRRLYRVVHNYLSARFTSAQALEDIRAFRTYSAYLRKPYDAQQQVFAQKLFDRLLAQGLTPPPTADLLMAKTKVRQRYVVEAIALADEQHPDAFVAELKAVVRADAPAATAPAGAAVQQPEAVSPALIPAARPAVP